MARFWTYGGRWLSSIWWLSECMTLGSSNGCHLNKIFYACLIELIHWQIKPAGPALIWKAPLREAWPLRNTDYILLNVKASTDFKLCFGQCLKNLKVLISPKILVEMLLLLKYCSFKYSSKQGLNQPLNQPPNQPLNQPLNRPLNQLLNQSLNQPPNQPCNQPFNQPLNHPLNHIFNQAFNQAPNWPPRQTLKWPINIAVNECVSTREADWKSRLAEVYSVSAVGSSIVPCTDICRCTVDDYNL